jgi:hypothetical protein
MFIILLLTVSDEHYLFSAKTNKSINWHQVYYESRAKFSFAAIWLWRHELFMSIDSDSTDRRPGDYVVFTLTFLGFMIAVAGVIVSSPAAAVAGLFLLLLSILGFGVMQPSES